MTPERAREIVESWHNDTLERKYPGNGGKLTPLGTLVHHRADLLALIREAPHSDDYDGGVRLSIPRAVWEALTDE